MPNTGQGILEEIGGKLDCVAKLLEKLIEHKQPRAIVEQEELPLLVSTRDAAKLLSISERMLYTITSSGHIGRVKVGARTLYPVAELRRYVVENLATTCQ
jgi:excisionase family DNA binding protein